MSYFGEYKYATAHLIILTQLDTMRFFYVQLFLFLLTNLLSPQLFSQRIERSQNIIDTLCSPYYGGRGYAHEGHNRAASYIANSYNALGVDPVYPGYFHQFNLRVNLFPDRMSVKSTEPLITGRDYIVSPSSGSGDDHYLVFKPTYGKLKASKLKKQVRKKSRTQSIALTLDSSWWKADHKEIAVIKKWLTSLENVCLIQFKSSLTWSTARTQDGFPSIWVGQNGWNKLGDYVEVVIDAELTIKQSQNVVGMIQGTEVPDSFIWFTAHYDHLGYMGKDVYIPGANDNASGIAMMLEMARYYSENPPRYSMIFVGFSGEEAGLVGSYHLANSPPEICPLPKIRFLINIDLMGSGEDGIMAVNGSVFKDSWAALDSINKSEEYLKVVKRRGKAANSDHYFFVEQGVPGFFFYLMGEFSYYHEVDDNAHELQLSGHYEKAFYLFRDFVNYLTSSSQQ